MNARHPFIFYQKYFYDKMDLRIFYFHVTKWVSPMVSPFESSSNVLFTFTRELFMFVQFSSVQFMFPLLSFGFVDLYSST